jgi:hypothetical protein
MSKEEYEPAFPYEIKNVSKEIVSVYGHEVKPRFCYSHAGMTLRDYFAAKSLASIPLALDDGEQQLIANAAYRMADAMLRARGQ